ncbi:E3 ubiquitin-protein ligase RNF183 [Pseudoliparis swirei]|uniref:E3 ubiquitin-protein ligase RNF183 n=1 Tax=Pseudoliparis swirei TaxID=2059687 RepID=UPI0024BD7552|nr:E3 ubiquitin-protein ligase RNF183 [Pseudoliparis swirei]
MSGGDREGPGGPLAPNVKPKLLQKEANSKEDAWRKEKPSRARRSVSTSSERTERSRRRERDHRGRADRRRRGRSEEARGGRDRRAGERRAPPPGDEVEDTECAVCFCSYDNVFRTPKLLACGHTFCLECLARINVASAELKTLCCPVCREFTELPHGRDLPRLGNNQDVIGKLPAAMRTARSIRFKRSRGKLLLKSPPRGAAAPGFFTLLKKKSPPAAAGEGEGGDLHLGALEQGIAPATVVDVGRPPSRVRGRLRRLFRSDQCYYVVVAAIATVTVALMLVGILAFVILPRLSINPPPPGPGGNQTVPGAPN